MVCDDIAVRRARDLERYHRRAAERRASGLCVRCGKRPPEPERSDCGPCAGKRRPADRERQRRRSAERVAHGLCPRCGKQPPAPERSVCEPCAGKARAAGRARDARLRAEGKPCRDRWKARISDRRRNRRQVAERRAQGLCPSCGKRPPADGASQCGPCSARRRGADRERYAAGKAADLKYGGRNVETRRRNGRARSRKRRRARIEAGLCTRCGQRPPVDGGTNCEPCRQSRRAAGRARYAARRQAGLCIYCAEPTFDGGSRCAPCAVHDAARGHGHRSPERKNAASRKLYARRRARGLCTACGRSSRGASRCAPCAKQSYEGSAHFRGLPLYAPRYTVIELATGEDHGTFDSWEDVALCLAFARLSRDRVEVIADEPPMARYAAWT